MFRPLEICVHSPSGVVPGNIPCSVGIPLVPGETIFLDRLALYHNGNRLEQSGFFEIPWHGLPGHRRIVAEFLLPHFECGKDTLLLREDDSPELLRKKVKIHEIGSRIEIDTGAAVFCLSKEAFFPFEKVMAGDRVILKAENPPKVLYPNSGGPLSGRVTGHTIERRSGFRTDLALKVVFPGQRAGGADIQLEATFSFFAGCTFVRTSVKLWNPAAAVHKGGLWDLGDPHSWHFNGFEIPFSFNFGSDPCCRYRIQADNSESILATGADFVIHQNSSGGPNWNSLNHVDCHDIRTVKFKGFRASAGQEQIEGERAEPALFVSGDPSEEAFGCTAAFEDFSERFPTSMEYCDGTLVMGMFPVRDGQLFELQGGEKSHKVFWLDFNADLSSGGLVPQAVSRLSLMPDTERMMAASAFPALFLQPDGEKDFFRKVGDLCVEGPLSMDARIHEYDEFGWRNFGEIPADHEKQHYQNDRELVSHYNNQYDVVQVFLSQYYRTSDCRWFRLARDLADHVTHIDIYHTEQDRSIFNGGLFWHTFHYRHAGTATHRGYSRRAFNGGKVPRWFGGGISNEHHYTSGLMYMYLHTGEPVYLKAVMQMADHVIRQQDGRLTALRFLAKGPTGLATCTRDLRFQGPGRGGAYSINALLDAWCLSGEKKYLLELEWYFRICIHPNDKPGEMDLPAAEERWSYTVFLQALGRYLDFKHARGEMDDMFEYGRAALLTYASWMRDKEFLFMERPEILEFPNATWPAQDFRKGCVFLYAARFSPEKDSAAFISKAGIFFQGAVDWLEKCEDWFTVRPVVLTLGNLAMYYYWKNQETWNLGLKVPRKVGLEKNHLVPQKVVALKRAKLIAAGTAISTLLGMALFLYTLIR